MQTNHRKKLLKAIFLSLIGIVLVCGSVLGFNTTNLTDVEASAGSYSLSFGGTGTGYNDRVEIPVINNPLLPFDSITNPGNSINIGATGFTIEFWMKVPTGVTNTPVGGGNGWIWGNIIIDRDIYGDYPDDFGISLYNGNIRFGTGSNVDTNTIQTSGVNVADGQWHHIAVVRESSGQARIYIDGTQRASGNVQGGDISYKNNYNSGLQTGPCNRNMNPYLVFGAEKHDYFWCAESDVTKAKNNAYNGLLDDVRISNTVRYSSNFTRPTAPHQIDANTVGMFRFDEGSGNIATNSANSVNGEIRRASPSAFPTFSTDTPFGSAPAGTTPDPFDIQNMTNQLADTVVTTNAITITGINTTVNATTTLGTIVKNGTNTNQTSTTVVNGDNLAIRLTTSPNYSTTLNGTLTVGTVSDNFSVTTIECFEDVQSASIPFHKTICNLKKNGVIHGYLIDGKRYYKSSNHVTRGEMAKFIKNGANIPTNTTCQSFPDVQPDAPFYEEITSLKCANIVQGYPVGNGIRHYRLSNNVTRGEMAAFIFRAFKIQTNTSCQNFPDVGPNDQFYTEITSLKCASIIQGYLGNDGKRYYRPSNHVTRGEMSVFIDNARN